jgi:hypothetical protein
MSPRASWTKLGNIWAPGGSFQRGVTDGILFGDSVVAVGGGLPAGLVFPSSWSTATGNSEAAIRDTGRARPWSTTNMNGGSPAVVSSGGAFPTTNALRLVWSAGNLNINDSAGYIPVPGVGEYVTHRFFWMMLSGGSFRPAINTAYETSSQGAFGAQWFPTSSLSQDAPYELQLRLRVIATLQWQIDTVVYADPAGARTIVLATDDFEDWESASDPLDGYTFTEGVQDQLDRLAGLTISTEETEQPTHPYYPLYEGAPDPFPDAPWSWHHEHNNATGNYALLGGVTICAGLTSESEWPLRAWSSAEENWSP